MDRIRRRQQSQSVVTRETGSSSRRGTPAQRRGTEIKISRYATQWLRPLWSSRLDRSGSPGAVHPGDNLCAGDSVSNGGGFKDSPQEWTDRRMAKLRADIN